MCCNSLNGLFSDSLCGTCSSGLRHASVVETLNRSCCTVCECGCKSVMVDFCDGLVTDVQCFPALSPMKAGTDNNRVGSGVSKKFNISH